MRRILIVGGITEAKQLCRQLMQQEYRVFYSIVGNSDGANHHGCEVNREAFIDSGHIEQYLQKHKIDNVVDCTHPYAQQIKKNLQFLDLQEKIKFCAYRRPEWQPTAKDNWQEFSLYEDLRQLLQPYERIFCTLGRSALKTVPYILPHQTWWFRCLLPTQKFSNYTIVYGRGPFSRQQEINQFNETGIQALVCKNSGHSSVEAKLHAARELQIPVFIQRRPTLPGVQHSFSQLAPLMQFVLS